MTPSTTTTMNVLLADDDDDDRSFFKSVLSDMETSTQLTIVNDGQYLMDYLLKNLVVPDVIFIDFNMPRKNGLECLIEIKNNVILRHIPVIIYSTSVREAVANTLYQNGAHYYLQKGDYNDLAKSIEGVLSLLAENPPQPARDQFIIKEKEY